MSTYTTFAKEKLLDLYSSHDHEVGSQLKLQKPEAYKDLQSTDCFTYSLRVMSYAFENSGNSQAAKAIWNYGKKELR